MNKINFKEEYAKGFNDKTRKYFIEKNLYTFSATDNGKVPFTLFPRQYEFIKSLTYNKNTIAIKHRQAGITTITSAWVTSEFVFTKKDNPITVLCIGNKLDISEQLVEKIKDFLLQVPRWYWGSAFYHPDPEHENNTKSIFVKENKAYLQLFNGCRVYARSSGPNAARGISAVSVLILDEAAFIQNGMTVYSQAAASTATVPNSKIVMISTPNGKDELYYNTYRKSLSNENNFTHVEFKWYQDPRYNRRLRWIKELPDGTFKNEEEPIIDEKGNIPYNEEKWREMEKNGWIPRSPWYIDMCNSLNNDSKKIAQELDLSFLGSVDTVVPKDVIEAHQSINVIEIDEDWKYKDPLLREMYIFELPISGHRYVIGCDNSNGSSDDDTAIEIIDIDAIDENGTPYFNQVAEYCGKIRGNEAGFILDRYGRLYNNALIVVEDIGGYGTATILKLLELGYPNMYYDIPELKTFNVKDKINIYNTHNTDKLPGFHMSSVRTQMIDNFVHYLSNNGLRIRSIRVINQLETWIFKNGRVDHSKSKHDDTLMCLAMMLFIIVYYYMKRDSSSNENKSLLETMFLVNSDNTYKQNVRTNNVTNKYVLPGFIG